MPFFYKLLKKNYLKKSIALSAIIFSPILFGKIESIPISSSNLKEREQAKEFYQNSSLARSAAVEIIIPSASGSGVIIEKNGREYTILTAWHLFEDIDLELPFNIRTADYNFHEVNIETIKQIQNLDMAIFTFETDKEYETVNFSNLSMLKKGAVLFSSGFADSNFYFQKGEVIAMSKVKVKDGNQLVYTSKVVPGMSGGGIFDNYGQLVGINTMSTSNSFQDKSSSYSIGVPNSHFINFKNGTSFDYSKELITIEDHLVKATELNNEKGNSKLIIDLLDRKPKFFENESQSASSWYLYHRLCLAKKDLNDNISALENCLKAIQIKPLDSSALFTYGNIQSKMNDHYGAISTYNKYLKVAPNDYYFLVHRAISKRKLGDYEGGLFDLNKAIEIDPDKEEAYFSRALLKDELKDYYGAISDYNKSILINAEQGLSFLNRSILKEKINDLDGACFDAKKAVSLGEESSENKSWIKENC